MCLHLPIGSSAIAVTLGCTRCNVGPFLPIAHGSLAPGLGVGDGLLACLVHAHTLYLLLRRLMGFAGARRPELLAACPALRSALLISDDVRGVCLLTFWVGLQY